MKTITLQEEAYNHGIELAHEANNVFDRVQQTTKALNTYGTQPHHQDVERTLISMAQQREAERARFDRFHNAAGYLFEIAARE